MKTNDVINTIKNSYKVIFKDEFTSFEIQGIDEECFSMIDPNDEVPGQVLPYDILSDLEMNNDSTFYSDQLHTKTGIKAFDIYTLVK